MDECGITGMTVLYLLINFYCHILPLGNMHTNLSHAEKDGGGEENNIPMR